MERLNHPSFTIKLAYWILFILGGLNLVMGFAALIFNVEMLLQAGVEVVTILTGLILLTLGYLVMQRKIWALYIAIALFVLSGIWAYIYTASMPSGNILCTLMFRFLLIIPLYRAIAATKFYQTSN
jgi:hypothetical protein